MKYIKIAIAVIIVAIVAVLIWLWLGNGLKSGEGGEPPKNQFVERIQRDIDSIQRVPDNVLCNKFYDKINNDIAEYHRQKFLGANEKDNDEWADLLRKRVYAAYVDKFLLQMDYTFHHSEWKDMALIRNEVTRLRKSDYLEKNGPADNDLKRKQEIVNKYFQITNFISTCKNCPFPDFNINTEFDQSDKIQTSKEYLRSLNGTLLNNCTRLRDGLQNCPQYLYERHKQYLSKKFEKLYTEDKEYAKFSDENYYDQMYDPLLKQIGKLKNNTTYGIDSDTKNKECRKLTKKLQDLDLDKETSAEMNKR